mmetsp:Transcript_25486/g.57462  ORF Transcript_25486/g.57462 Transcript_25486/m.57462 type:complete len:209 (-) Transcript_25486:4138-4764(-)
MPQSPPRPPSKSKSKSKSDVDSATTARERDASSSTPILQTPLRNPQRRRNSNSNQSQRARRRRKTQRTRKINARKQRQISPPTRRRSPRMTACLRARPPPPAHMTGWPPSRRSADGAPDAGTRGASSYTRAKLTSPVQRRTGVTVIKRKTRASRAASLAMQVSRTSREYCRRRRTARGASGTSRWRARDRPTNAPRLPEELVTAIIQP